MIDDILTAIPLGFLLSFMIGPVFFILLETSVVKGFRAAIAFDFGVLLADIVFILIAYFSSYRLIKSIKDEPALFIFGGLIMLTYVIISFDFVLLLAYIVFILIAYFGSYRLIKCINDVLVLFIFCGLIMLTYGIISFIRVKKKARSVYAEDPRELAKKNYMSLFIKGFF